MSDLTRYAAKVERLLCAINEFVDADEEVDRTHGASQPAHDRKHEAYFQLQEAIKGIQS